MSAPEIEPQIAISYSRRDESRVVPILDGLRAKGLAVWFDKDIPGGTLWEEIIARKYRAASGLAFFLSRASLESQRCFEEVSTARTLGKPIFPVLLERMKLPDELPDRFVLTLQARNVIDVIDDDAEAAVAKLLRAFDAHGVKPGDAPVAPPAPTPIPKPAPAAAAPTAPLPPRAATPSPAVLGGIVGGLVVAIGIALWATGVFGGGGAPAPAAPAPSAPAASAPAPTAAAAPETPAPPASPPAAAPADPAAPVRLAKTEFVQGEPIEIEIARDAGIPEDARGYLTLAEPGSGVSSYVRYAYVDRDKPRAEIAPVMAPGAYELRFFRNEREASRESDVAVRIPVTVKPIEGVEIAAEGALEVGKPLTVRFKGLPGNERDMFTLAEAAMGAGEYKRYVYTKGAREGTVTLAPVMRPGAYEVRLFFADDTGDRTVIARLALEAPEREPPTLTLDGDPVTEGQRIRAGFGGMPGNARDYIAVARAGTGPSEYVSYAYTKGEAEGTVELPALTEAGDYELRALFDDSVGEPVVQAALPFTVGAAAGVELTLDAASVGDAAPIRVRFSGFPGNAGDSVAIAYATAEPGAYEVSKPTRGEREGEIVFEPLSQIGEFEVRAFFENDSAIRGRVAFEVVEMAPPGMAADRETYLPGQRIVVAISGFPGNQNDAVALAAAGSPAEETLGMERTKGQVQGTVNLTAPSEPGDYELRAFFNGESGEAAVRARLPIAVRTAAEMEAEPVDEPAPAEDPAAAEDPAPAEPAAEAAACSADDAAGAIGGAVSEIQAAMLDGRVATESGQAALDRLAQMSAEAGLDPGAICGEVAAILEELGL